MIRSAFSYRNGVLCAEALPLAEIAEAVDTPFFCTSVSQLGRNAHDVLAPFARAELSAFYAVKANPNLAIIRTLAENGVGAAIASADELARVLEVGLVPSQIILSGIRKTRDDIEAALIAGLAQINVASLGELDLIEEVARSFDRVAPIVLRYDPELPGQRPMMGLDAAMMAEALGRVMTSAHLNFKGLMLPSTAFGHDQALLKKAYESLARLVGMIRTSGFDVELLDLGGGLGLSATGAGGMAYPDYVACLKATLLSLGCRLVLEPGRRFVESATVLVTSVMRLRGADKKVLLIDAGLSSFMRPGRAGPTPEILAAREPGRAPLAAVSLMDPHGETTHDFDGKLLMPEMMEGDILTVMNAGAFGHGGMKADESSPTIPEVMVSGVHHAVVRRRLSVAEQMVWEAMPDWMGIIRAA